MVASPAQPVVRSPLPREDDSQQIGVHINCSLKVKLVPSKAIYEAENAQSAENYYI